MYVLYEVYGLYEVCKVYQEYIIEGKRGILDTSLERESIYFHIWSTVLFQDLA